MPVETTIPDGEPLWTWSFCFMPNAGNGPPHVGHLLHVGVIRWLYSYAQMVKREQDWPVRFQFNIYFDYDPPQECADQYLRMFEWLKWPLDRIDTRRQWLRVSQGPHYLAHGESNRLVNIIAFLPQNCTDGDPHRILHKVMYWRETGVYWIVRGPELMDHSQKEAMATTYLPFLRDLPRVFYHPLAADGNGKKIDCKDCVDEYKFDDLIEADHDPDDVLRAVLQSADYTPAGGDDLRPLFTPEQAVPCRPDRCVVRWAQRLYGRHSGPMGFHDPTFLRCKLNCNDDAHINIPFNWRDKLAAKQGVEQ